MSKVRTRAGNFKDSLTRGSQAFKAEAEDPVLGLLLRVPTNTPLCSIELTRYRQTSPFQPELLGIIQHVTNRTVV